jgi:hypothetical protein
VCLCNAALGEDDVNIGLIIKLKFHVTDYVRTQALHVLICIIQQPLLSATS